MKIAAFIDWLKVDNTNLPADKRVGFNGLDLYSFSESMNSIIPYVEKNNTVALAIVKTALKCYESYGKGEGQSNAQASSYIPELYEKEILHMFTEIVKNVPNYNHDAENLLSKEHNAFIVRNTEKYYLGMIKKSSASWNIRDEQMVSIIAQLMKLYGKDAKIIVWEHNTHIGDARATNMAYKGMISVVQILRE